MTIDFDADLSEMISSDDHAIKFTVGSSTTEYEGIFNREFFLQDGGTTGMASSEPMLYVKSSLVQSLSIAEGTKITIASESFTVRVPESDGNGVTCLVMTLN